VALLRTPIGPAVLHPLPQDFPHLGVISRHGQRR
jgi:hypothetical protein